MLSLRGPLATRMIAYRGVLGAAALTTVVAAAVGAALAVFAGQALPIAARHDLAVAPGTSVTVSGPASLGQLTSDGQQLRRSIGAAVGVPLSFYQAAWSDPLGLVPGARPASPASAGRGNTPIVEAAGLAGIATRAVLVAGTWPSGTGQPSSGGATIPGRQAGPVPTALPAASAALLHVSVGDVLAFRDRLTGAAVRFRVTGLFAPASAAADFWKLNRIPAAGYGILGGFATYGPLAVDPAVFTSGTLPVDEGSWVAQPDLGDISGGDLGAAAARLTALQQSLPTSPALGGMELTTSLPAVLQGTASELAVARSLLVISALQLLLLAVAALLATARLLASQREAEFALLAARGATRWQLIRLTAAEVIPLALAAAAAGAIAGTWLARMLAGSGPLRGAGLALPGPLDGAAIGYAVAAAAAIALCAILALLVPLLGTGARPGAALVRRGRQAAIAAATRAGADVSLVLLAVAAGWELRRYSAVSDITGTGGSAGVDPVLALAPALALAGGTVAMLRLLPAAARLADRLAARGRRLTPALAGWQFSRQPLRSGGAALLLIMAVATATLGLAQHDSWARSVSDQAAFSAGAATRVNLPVPLAAGQAGTITGSPGAMAVSRQPQATPEVLAIGADRAAGTTLLRGDESPAPAALFRQITPSSTPGTTIPAGTATITLTATLTAPALARSGGSGGAIIGLRAPAVTVIAMDSSGASYQFQAGTLPADGRPHGLSAGLGGSHASDPLRLIAIDIAYPMPAAANAQATVTLSGAALPGWSATASSADLANVQSGHGTFSTAAQPSVTAWRPAASGTSTVTFSTGFGRASAGGGAVSRPSPQPLDALIALTAAAAGPPPVPGIATQAFLDSSNTRVGSTVMTGMAGIQVPVRIVASVHAFPTVAGSALIVDLASVEQFLAAAASAAPLPVTEWWLSSPPPAGLPPGTVVTTQAGLAAQLTSQPLSAAPQQALLALTVAAAALAITGFCVSIATGVRARRGETALLAALGVGQRSATIQLCLEKLLLSVSSAVLGLLLGAAVAWLLVPAVTLTGAAARPVPPPLVLLDLPQAVPLAAVIALLPVVIAAIVMIRRPDPAAELRASES